jgi:hypothetical protein
VSRFATLATPGAPNAVKGKIDDNLTYNGGDIHNSKSCAFSGPFLKEAAYMAIEFDDALVGGHTNCSAETRGSQRNSCSTLFFKVSAVFIVEPSFLSR